MKELGIGIIGLTLLLGLGWVIAGNGLAMKGFFQPRSVAIDNRVFHESQQYNDGMSRDLDNLRQAYMDPQATDAAKEMVRATIMHRFGNYDLTRLPPDQQAFLTSIRGY